MVLMVALSTLVVIDRVTPLPLLLAREAINEAEAQRNTEKDSARELLDTARYELGRGHGARLRDTGPRVQSFERRNLESAETTQDE